MTVITQETLTTSGITLAKLFGRQQHEIARFEEANQRLASVATRQQVIGQAFFTVVMTFLGVTPVLIYLAAGIILDSGAASLSAGTIVAFTTLQTRLFFPVARILEVWVELQSSRAMFRRIFRYLDEEPEVVERQVLAISFDEQDMVQNIERFGLEDGQIVPLARRVTSTSVEGKGFLRQLLGNIGNFNPGALLNNN